MSLPNFGLTFQTVDEEPRPIIGADLSVIGLIGVAANRDRNVYPHVDRPYLLSSKDANKVKAMGGYESAFYIRDAIDGINDQLSAGDQAATIIFVPVWDGTGGPGETDPAIAIQRRIRNIVGDSTLGTGLWAFTRAPHTFGVTPRIILAPGYTSQMANQLHHITLVHSGRGYDSLHPPAVTFTGGGTSTEIQQAAGYAVIDDGQPDGPGRVTRIVLTKPGVWYTIAPTITIAPPPGGEDLEAVPIRRTATATATIIARANPVVAELPGVLEQLQAHAVVESAGTSERGDIRWRQSMDSKRLIPMSGGIVVANPDRSAIDYGAPIPVPVASRVAGALIRRDYETGAPFHSAANQPLSGVLGTVRQMKFSISDGDNQGQRLLAANVGIVVRGEIGSDTALSSGGYVLVATDNAGDDELWRFYNVTRGRDFIHISAMRALRYFLGRFNITGQTIQSIVNTLNFFLRDLKADGHILGYKVDFQGGLNSAEEIRLGHLTVSFAAEEPPVLKRITTISARYRQAIDDMVADLERTLNTPV
jgi:phage tail sheath protein FI